jgi:hypothetical protein
MVDSKALKKKFLENIIRRYDVIRFVENVFKYVEGMGWQLLI